MKTKYEGHTPAKLWHLFGESGTLTIQVGSAFIPAPYQEPHGRGKCPRQNADGELIADAPALLAALVKIVEAQDTQLQHARTIEGATDRAVSVLVAIAEAKKLIGGEE